jgi:hypothetical protein
MVSAFHMQSRAGFRRIVTLCVAVVFLSACTKSTHVSPHQLDDADRESAREWHVTMVDNRIYWVDAFTVTESTIVIEKATRLYKNSYDRFPKYLKERDLPVVLPLDQVVSIEKIETRTFWTVVAVTFVAGLALTALLFYAYVHGLDESLN